MDAREALLSVEKIIREHGDSKALNSYFKELNMIKQPKNTILKEINIVKLISSVLITHVKNA